ncbi:Basic-leucine zipper (bZIP) transcription factor [Macrophomina phaseolina MS6]|uniref:Basic-leucine zipper (BZIP) transcription factor n=1 Tax=Macrophomina phaseolina (strain MS6) TaxID=1126212 RepID=K2S4K1_MACPH|nr:Basic-leucine zipper (bZIP) transcription factor [Macrophomina phaseolina MS6]
MTEHAFAFDPRPGPGADMVDYADPTTLSAPFGNFFDDVFMTKVSFVQRGNPNAASTLGMYEGVRPETVDPDVLSGQSNREMSSDGAFPESPEEAAQNTDSARSEETPPENRAVDQTRTTPPDEGKRRSPNKAKKQSPGVRGRPKKTTDAEEAQRRREQNLEKNRVAANKCRQKKKNWMAKMDDRHRDLAARNRFLKAEVGSLSSTILELKELVFQHVECGYAPIGEYVKAEAYKVQYRNRSQSRAWFPMDESGPQYQLQSGPSSAHGFLGSDSGSPQLRSPPSAGFTQPTDLRSTSISPGAAGTSQPWLGP